MKHDFKPFQKVLVRDVSAGDGWRASFFSHYHCGKPATINGWEFGQMIPYEGNERLLGTNEDPEKPLKNGDTVLVWDEGDMMKRISVYSHYDFETGKHAIYVYSDKFTFWDHAQKFVPASVEDREGHRQPD